MNPTMPTNSNKNATIPPTTPPIKTAFVLGLDGVGTKLLLLVKLLLLLLLLLLIVDEFEVVVNNGDDVGARLSVEAVEVVVVFISLTVVVVVARVVGFAVRHGPGVRSKHVHTDDKFKHMRQFESTMNCK